MPISGPGEPDFPPPIQKSQVPPDIWTIAKHHLQRPFKQAAILARATVRG
jgi:hypothetical protein